jgi:hypothetical protein
MVRRILRTSFGEVAYWRTYLKKKNGKQGLYPLDIELGLFADGFSPRIIGLATRLSTRMSFNTCVLVLKAFMGWSPSQRTICELTLGLGKHAPDYIEQTRWEQVKDEDIVVVEIDGKATPTATEAEMKKRRGKRACSEGCECGCQRHRGRQRRLFGDRRKRRKKGDKSKNGKSVTVVAVYVLKRGEDGKLHGPYQKRVWASYSPRKAMLDWARKEVQRRGVNPDQATNIHVVSDGEKCLNQGLKKRFPRASMALDIRHVEERLWEVGRMFHKEATDELEQWMDHHRTYLYHGEIDDLLDKLKEHFGRIASRGPGTKAKREKLQATINYIEIRKGMMDYGNLLVEDLVIASGVIEGAVRHVMGERMDCSGMRWTIDRAEALLHLRCIEINKEWDSYYDWVRDKIAAEQRAQCRGTRIRTNQPSVVRA